jgi:hypothetical protein
MGLLAPPQTRTLDPFTEDRLSTSINRYTRIYTGGSDCLLYEDYSYLFSYDTTSVNYVHISSGSCIKDDLLIETDADGVDFSNDDYYLDDSPGMLSSGIYYIVLYYNSVRRYPPPKAYFRIIRDRSIFPTYISNYLFLGSVNIIDSGGVYQVDHSSGSLQYVDPDNPSVIKRNWLNLTWLGL